MLRFDIGDVNVAHLINGFPLQIKFYENFVLLSRWI